MGSRCMRVLASQGKAHARNCRTCAFARGDVDHVGVSGGCMSGYVGTGGPDLVNAWRRKVILNPVLIGEPCPGWTRSEVSDG